jgi:hypothetical protein
MCADNRYARRCWVRARRLLRRPGTKSREPRAESRKPRRKSRGRDTPADPRRRSPPFVLSRIPSLPRPRSVSQSVSLPQGPRLLSASRGAARPLGFRDSRERMGLSGLPEGEGARSGFSPRRRSRAEYPIRCPPAFNGPLPLVRYARGGAGPTSVPPFAANRRIAVARPFLRMAAGLVAGAGGGRAIRGLATCTKCPRSENGIGDRLNHLDIVEIVVRSDRRLPSWASVARGGGDG